MELPPLFNWFSVALLVVCVIGIPLLLFVGWIISGIADNKQQEKREAQNNALRKRGVTVPAIVASARKGMARSPFGRKEIRIDYEVDVQAEGRTPFRQSFQHWEERRGYTVIAGQLMGEQGRKIWVTYDPNDPSQMIFEHYDEDHEKILKQQAMEERRSNFKRRIDENVGILASGEEAQARILSVEDLDVTYDWEEIKGMRFKLEVTPKSGSSFRSEAYGRPGINKLEKYSVGNTLFVKYDPRNHERAAFDADKNKSIQ